MNATQSVGAVLRFTVPGAPVPCGRPRVVRGHTFMPDRTRAYEDRVRIVASLAARSQRWAPPKGANFAVSVDVYRARQAGDADNFLKSALDGMIGVAYPDDRLVTEAHVRLFVDRACPRVEVEVSTRENPAGAST